MSTIILKINYQTKKQMSFHLAIIMWWCHLTFLTYDMCFTLFLLKWILSSYNMIEHEYYIFKGSNFLIKLIITILKINDARNLRRELKEMVNKPIINKFKFVRHIFLILWMWDKHNILKLYIIIARPTFFTYENQ